MHSCESDITYTPSIFYSSFLPFCVHMAKGICWVGIIYPQHLLCFEISLLFEGCRQVYKSGEAGMLLSVYMQILDILPPKYNVEQFYQIGCPVLYLHACCTQYQRCWFVPLWSKTQFRILFQYHYGCGLEGMHQCECWILCALVWSKFNSYTRVSACNVHCLVHNWSNSHGNDTGSKFVPQVRMKF